MTPEPAQDDRAPWRPGPLLRASVVLHGLAAVALWHRPERWRTVAPILAADHLALCLAGTLPRSSLLGPNLVRCPEVGDGRVVLTFDDGPDPEATPAVLELLATHGARASFFLIGRHAERHPELVEQIVAGGHRVENHTYHHRHDFAFRWSRALTREIGRAQQVLGRLAGRRPRWFRAPAGMRNPFLDRVLHQTGLRLVSWTRRGLDAVDHDPRRVVRRLVRGLAAGDVLLLHDGYGPREASGRPVVLETLPRLLEALERHGVSAVPLPDPA